MSTGNKREVLHLSPQAISRLDRAIVQAGGQSAVARQLGINRQGLNSVLRTGKGVSRARLEAIAEAVGTDVDYVLKGADGAQVDTVDIPIVEIEASAGPGRATALQPSIVDQLTFPASYARKLGQVSALRLVTARGDSQEPEIRDGDLVMYEEGPRYRAEGMYVIVLDGDLMIKRLQRSAEGMRVLSINPAYQPIEIRAQDVEHRLRVLGRVVWSGKQW